MPPTPSNVASGRLTASWQARVECAHSAAGKPLNARHSPAAMSDQPPIRLGKRDLVLLIALGRVGPRHASEPPDLVPRVLDGVAPRNLTGAVVDVFFSGGDREAHVDLLPAVDNLCASDHRVLDPEKRQQVMPMGGDISIDRVLYLALHLLAEQLSGLVGVLRVSRLADLVERLPGDGAECLSVELRVNLPDRTGVHARKCGGSAVQEPGNCSIDLRLLEVDKPLLVGGDFTEMKQMFLNAGHELIPAPSTLQIPARSLTRHR